MNLKKLTPLGLILSILSVSVMVGFVVVAVGEWLATEVAFSGLLSKVGTVATALALFYLFFVTRTLAKNPKPLQIALIGPPGAGKTVFLTVLFGELEAFGSSWLVFQPYGLETIERVREGVSRLKTGKWPYPTPVSDNVFFFRANARINGFPFARRYTIEAADFAGELIGQFDSKNTMWLHRSEYFRYAIRSDAVFLAADAGLLLGGGRDRISETESILLAALQVLIDERGVGPEERLPEPVALIVLKADLFGDLALLRKATEAGFGRLLSVAQVRCKSFAVFFVSSVGDVGEEGQPPAVLQPSNVIEPMLWVLRHAGHGRG